MTKRGWLYDIANSRGSIWSEGTEVQRFAAGAVTLTGTLTSSGALTVTAGGLTVTAGGLTVTAGGAVVTAGDAAVTAGNVRVGAIEAFGTTEPTSWIVFKAGTQPAGAITTSSGVGADATTVQKILAAGTVSAVET